MTPLIFTSFQAPGLWLGPSNLHFSIKVSRSEQNAFTCSWCVNFLHLFMHITPSVSIKRIRLFHSRICTSAMVTFSSRSWSSTVMASNPLLSVLSSSPESLFNLPIRIPSNLVCLYFSWFCLLYTSPSPRD